MAEQHQSAPRREADLPAWPLGCLVALLNSLFLFSMVGLIGFMISAAGLPALLIWLAIAPLPLAELFGALWLRRRNPYAAACLAWGLAITVALLALTFAVTSWLDQTSGL